MKPFNSAPSCCAKESTWVYLSYSLKYFYCKKCKKEVYCSEFHFISNDKCKPYADYKTVSEHYWPEIDNYKKKKKCNCGYITPQ